MMNPNTMDSQRHRIHAILGKQSARHRQNAVRYLEYLKKAITLPCRLTGITDFPWERAYGANRWENRAYQGLRKDNPSFTDQFELIALLPPESGHDEIVARVARCEDGKIFEIGLAGLECVDFKGDNFQLFDDYVTWHNHYPENGDR